MKAIRTRYKGPTNTRGSRIIASDEDGNRITIGYDDALDSEDAHRKGADALCARMHWEGEMVSGSLKDGYVFVFLKGDIRAAWRKDFDAMHERNKKEHEERLAAATA